MRGAKGVAISKKIPQATYRLQFNSNFTFKDAIDLISYFQNLGISHCYCSPILQAKKGTTHGYDLINPLEINSEIGTKDEFLLFAEKLKDAGMGLIIDIVPNHMYIGSDDNKWWQDVLKNGPSSSFAKYFDIDWENGKVILPILSEPNQQPNQVSQDVIEVNSRILPTMEKSHYRLVDWHSPDLNYRKFFDILDYAGMRIEDPEVYQKVHELIFSLKDLIDGLRVDHIDGLYDPLEYLERLKTDFPGYIVLEKILIGSESLPKEWPVDGNVGYDFLNDLNSLFVYQPHKKLIWDIYQKFTGVSQDVEELYYTSKKYLLETSFASEVKRLAKHLGKTDFNETNIKAAIIDVIALFPVYRTYIRPLHIRDEDREIIKQTIVKAKSRHSFTAIYDLIESVLLHPEKSEFAMRFQQLTGPIMAKGIEDTAFYRFFPLSSLNEVGSDLNVFGISLEDFHQRNAKRRHFWPHSMLATSTHDTKRGEDVRARINVLSEMPEIWEKKLLLWQQMNSKLKQNAPNKNEEYLLYQTLIGSLQETISDSYVSRIKEYMHKAIQEAKINSSWLEPNEAYHHKVDQFIEKILSANSPFFLDLSAFAASIDSFGFLNSLSQTLIKLTSPGVPDIYQGSELWNDSLVDPDNRRPVDFEIRKKMINEKKSNKLFLTKSILNCRKKMNKLFTYGDYAPLFAEGPLRNHVVAFARVYQSQAAIAITGRFYSLIHEKSWHDTLIKLPFQGIFQDIFTGKSFKENLPLVELFSKMPVALLIGDLQ